MFARATLVLLDLFLALSFALSGLVIGFCLGGLFGPTLFGRGGQGLEELGFMFNGAIFGAVAGVLVSIVVRARRPLAGRLRAAGAALTVAALTAALTWIAVNWFGAW